MSAGQAERSWARDRAELDDCRRRLSAVADFYARRDARLAGR